MVKCAYMCRHENLPHFDDLGGQLLHTADSWNIGGLSLGWLLEGILGEAVSPPKMSEVGKGLKSPFQGGLQLPWQLE